MHKNALITLALTLFAFAAVGHETKGPVSPPAKAEAVIGGKKIAIDYSAPSKRGRAVMGSLVPFGKVWRTGANAATTLRTETDLMVGGLHVPAGTYTLFTIPGEKEWTLIVNKQTGQWGTRYDEAQDLGRVKAAAKTSKDTVETFRIGLKPGAANDATLTLAWENTWVSFPLVVH